MINPSAIGWIDKFFNRQDFLQNLLLTTVAFMKSKSNWFYLWSYHFFNTPTQIQTKGWFKDEISKVALLTLLYDIFL
jgi:TRAP-type mannitol/chloroaromatic compound transport system substrate-binding protein